MDFNYFYDNMGLSRDRLRFLWEFDTSALSGVIDTSTGNYLHSGAFEPKSDFYSIAGKGLFGNTRVRMMNAAGLDTRQFTIIMDYSGVRNDSEILFSNYSTGSNPYGIGFSVCKNHCNRIYMAADTSDLKVEVKTFDINLANRNIIALRKAHNNVTLTHYNPYSSQLESQTHVFSHKVNSESASIYFGGNADFEARGYENDFSGTMEQVVYIDHAISDRDLSGILNGFRLYDSVPIETLDVLQSGHNRIEYGITGVHANHNAIFGEYTDSIHDHLKGLLTTNQYTLQITGSANGTILSLTGTLSGFVDSTLSFVSGYSLTGSSPNAYVSAFTGLSRYSEDTYGNTFSYHNHNYRGVTDATDTFKAYNSIYKKYAALHTGSASLNEAALDNYKMDGITVTTQDFAANYLLRSYDDFLIENFNKTARPNFSQTRLTIPGGTGIDLYVNRFSNVDYTFDGNTLLLEDTYSGDNYFYYDRPTVGSSYSLVTGTESGINHRLFKNSSVVHYEGNITRRLMLGIDYREVASLDLLYDKNLIPTQDLDTIYTGAPEYWNVY